MGDFGGNSYPSGAPVTEQERSWAMAAHLATMLGSAIPFGNILAPLAIWLMHKDKSTFVDKHARESMTYQLGVMAALFLLMIFVFATFGLGIFIAIFAILGILLTDFVYMILATVRANEGKIWEYPFTTRFVS